MGIKYIPDLGAPLVVTAIDLITESQAPKYNSWASYILAAGGYAAAFMGWGGDFTKNVAIASFPWAAKNIYTRVKAGGIPHMARMSHIGRYPAEAVTPQFAGVRLV